MVSKEPADPVLGPPVWCFANRLYPPGELLTSQTQGKDHDRLETRRLASTTALNDYLRWPDNAQVLRRTGRLESEVASGLISLPPDLTGPAQLEQIWRGHWTIENRVHYVPDVTLGEDRCNSGPVRPPKRWPPSPMRSYRCCLSTAGAISPPPATMPTSRNAPCASRRARTLSSP
jgi:hypothetical protein